MGKLHPLHCFIPAVGLGRITVLPFLSNFATDDISEKAQVKVGTGGVDLLSRERFFKR